MSYPTPAREATHLREIAPQQWKCGIAAWLGCFFDGLEPHLLQALRRAARTPETRGGNRPKSEDLLSLRTVGQVS